MNPIKRGIYSFLCCILCFSFCFSFFSFSGFASTDAEAENQTSSQDSPAETVDSSKIRAAYSFDEEEDLAADVGETYPLSLNLFGASALQSVPGYKNGGMSGYVALDNALISHIEQFSMGFWAKYSRAEAESKTTLFLAMGTSGERVELAFARDGGALYLQLTVEDGTRSVSCRFDMKDTLAEESDWDHYAFTYIKSGSVSMLTLYVNGKSTVSSTATDFVDLSQLEAGSAAFQGVTLDELYVTNVVLEQRKISALMGETAASFFESEKNAEEDSGGDSNPQVPDEPISSYDYSWAAYLFEGTFAAGTDFHSGDIPAAVDNSCVRIDSSRLSSKFGYAILRRENTAPAAYLTLDSRLINGQSQFTFACWVYRNGKTRSNDECLLDLNGNGSLRFAPYATEEDGTPAAYIEYTDSRGNLQYKTIRDGSPANPQGTWVHYALTVSASGDITVYVDGVFVETFSSGSNFATLQLSDCRVVTGASSSDATRTAIDEVYVSPKVLTAADIRKIHFYGVEQFTSQVLPDPGQTSTGGNEGDVNPYAPDSTDIAEDAYQQSGVIANGFIGTTFDDRSNMGKDWNASADAALTGGRLTQGISSYGLSFDGVASFVRYPIGIFDGAEELTVSLSYSWSGATSATNRSQRIFDFSRKSSSVADPVAFFYLETGSGISGLRFGMSDGINSTYLTCDYNAVDTWTRITVTVAGGVVTLYLNDSVAATASTEVDVASICPNFCYLGRSGVKGDPLFKGVMDEVYLSNQALPADQVPRFSLGLTAALTNSSEKDTDFWSVLLFSGIIVAALLLVGIVVVIIVVILRKDKKQPEVEPPVPVPLTGEDVTTPTIGPRSARRLRQDAGETAETDATMKFRKVNTETSALSDPVAPSETTAFRKIPTERPKESSHSDETD